MSEVHAAQRKTLTVRVDENEIAAWKEAAHIRRTTLSEWVRTVLDATAKSTIERNVNP